MDPEAPPLRAAPPSPSSIGPDDPSPPGAPPSASPWPSTTPIAAAPLTRGELLDVLENPAAPSERRVAAALALTGDDGARGRMRIAACAAADARLRVALLQAAEQPNVLSPLRAQALAR